MKVQEIKTFGSAFNGKTPSKEEQRSEGLPILKIRDIDENGHFRGVFESFVDPNFYEKHSKKRLKTGDTIILNAAHNSDYVGSKNAFIPPELDGVVATGEWLIVRVNEANPTYVNHFLKSPLGKKNLRNCVKGIHLYPKDVERIKIPLPQLDDQKRITYLLGKVEGAIAHRKQHLQQLDDLLKSVFLEMFGDPVRNEKGWEIKDLGEIASIERGRFSPRPRNDPKFYNGAHPFIQTGDISRSNGRLRDYTQTLNELGTKVSKEFKVGTIVIAIVGATIGETAILEISTYAPDSVIGITPIEGNVQTESVFIEYILRFWKPVLRAKAPEAARANINIETLRPLPIIWPQSSDERAKFVNIVAKIEGIKSRFQQSLTDLENLYGVLSQKAFKGELDLSRVPLTPESIEAAAAEIPETKEPQPTADAFELPAPSDLATLNSAEGRHTLLDQWLTVWLERLNDSPFSTQSFMEAAQQRLWELAEELEKNAEDAEELGAVEYDRIKAWMFESLKSGRLAQTYDDAKNCVQLEAVSH